jgi:hypothetical protein
MSLPIIDSLLYIDSPTIEINVFTFHGALVDCLGKDGKSCPEAQDEQVNQNP